MKIKVGKELVDSETGEVITTSPRFVKISNAGLKGLINLPTSAMNVFLYISSVLGFKMQYVEIDVNKCMKFCNYSSRSCVYKGIKTLLLRKIIIQKGNGYMVNAKYCTKRKQFNKN